MKNWSILLLVLGLFMGICTAAKAEIPEYAERLLNKNVTPMDLRTYGNADAPATLYVFSSLSCPHCAGFHNYVLPELLRYVVATGHANLVWVDMPYDARAMTGTMIARCLPINDYEKFISVMYDNQQAWLTAQDPKPIITGYANLLGMSTASVNACLSNKELQKAITNQRNNLANLYKVRGMPTVVVVQGTKSQMFTGSDKVAIMEGVRQALGY